MKWITEKQDMENRYQICFLDLSLSVCHKFLKIWGILSEFNTWILSLGLPVSFQAGTDTCILDLNSGTILFNHVFLIINYSEGFQKAGTLLQFLWFNSQTCTYTFNFMRYLDLLLESKKMELSCRLTNMLTIHVFGPSSKIWFILV